MSQYPVLSSPMAVVLSISCTSELSEALVKNADPWPLCPIGAALKQPFVWSLGCVFLTGPNAPLMQKSPGRLRSVSGFQCRVVLSWDDLLEMKTTNMAAYSGVT